LKTDASLHLSCNLTAESCADKPMPLDEAHYPDVVRYALKDFRHKTLRAILRGESEARKVEGMMGVFTVGDFSD
jgi:hypothetical protein